MYHKVNKNLKIHILKLLIITIIIVLCLFPIFVILQYVYLRSLFFVFSLDFADLYVLRQFFIYYPIGSFILAIVILLSSKLYKYPIFEYETGTFSNSEPSNLNLRNYILLQQGLFDIKKETVNLFTRNIMARFSGIVRNSARELGPFLWKIRGWRKR